MVFGPITPAPAYYLDPSIYAAFKWVHPGGQESGAESPMAADGSFSTTLEVPSSFVGPTGPIDCTSVPCAVITFGAHGSQDRSQDTCTSVTFLPATASGSPAPGGKRASRWLGPAVGGRFGFRVGAARRSRGVTQRPLILATLSVRRPEAESSSTREIGDRNEKTPPKRGLLHCPG